MNINMPDYLNPFVPSSKYDEFRGIANDLENKGYAIFDFPHEDFNSLAENIKADLSKKMNMEVVDNKGPRIQDYFQNDAVREIACNEKVLNMLSKLYGRNAFPFQTLNFPFGTQQKAHSDHVHFDSIPHNFMVGVWVALEDIDPDSGPLFVYEGSHKWPRVDNFFINHKVTEGAPPSPQYQKYLKIWETFAETSNTPKKPFLAKKGQCIIWSAHLVHGGSKQKDLTKTRWSQVTHYYFENCAYYTPLHSNEISNNYFLRQPKNILNKEIVRSSFLPGKK